VPVSLLGAFAGLYLLGYSINTLTLFGMVLAIGIVVDDAIVVLENVERIMREDGAKPREAAIKAMHEVTGPIVAIVLTLTAVFIPIAFLGGLTGELYRQFAVTISIAVVISGLVALTLTPALCAKILRHEEPPTKGFFALFNRGFGHVTHGYTHGVAWMIRRGIVGAVLYVGMVAIAVGLWRFVPGSLVPDEDQGWFFTTVILPDGATLQRTDEVAGQVEKAIRSNSANAHVIAFTGFDFLGNGFRNNAASIFVTQIPWDERARSRRRSWSARCSARPPASRRRWCSRSCRADPALAPRAARALPAESRRRRPKADERGRAGIPCRSSACSRASRTRRRCGAPTCRSSMSMSTARRRRRRACRSTTFSRRCLPRSARTTSTTSTSTAAPGKC
jgi:multidrug efflux pump subunit AcrB